MTVDELAAHINSTFGYQSPVPDTLVVDHDTYANVCWYVVNYIRDKSDTDRVQYPFVSFGRHGGIFFKNIELILKENEK
jgi:hypothetical protein